MPLTILLVAVASIVHAVLLKRFGGRKIHWLEAVAPIGVSLLICLGCKYLAETTATTDHEYWGGWVVRAEYREGWTEEYWVVVYDHDSKGNITGSHMERRTTYHPPSWDLHDSNDVWVRIDSDKFEWLCGWFGSRTFQRLHHSGQCSTGDGNMYFTEWPGDDRTFLPCATRHAYTNKVLAAKQSVFHFQPIDKGDKEAYGLFDRPKLTDYIAMQYLQGDASPAGQRANEALTRWNAKLGRAKQVSMRVLVFSGQPIQAALKQEAYWQRGTKNEFTVCVGVDRTGSVQWAHVLSWTDVERLKIDVRDFARSMGRWEPERLVEYMASKVRAEFVRKPFAEFDYLQIETPQWGRILAVVLAVIVTGGLDWFALSNEWSEEDSVVEAVGEFVRAMR